MKRFPDVPPNNLDGGARWICRSRLVPNCGRLVTLLVYKRLCFEGGFRTRVLREAGEVANDLALLSFLQDATLHPAGIAQAEKSESLKQGFQGIAWD